LRNKVEGKDHLIKDEVTGAVINTDRSGYVAVKRRRAISREQTVEIQTLKSEVLELKSMVTELIGNRN